MMDYLLAISRSGGGSANALRVFFAMVDVGLMCVGIYLFRNRNKMFDHRGQEQDSYASANLRLAMVILVWLHAVVLTSLMIFEVK